MELNTFLMINVHCIEIFEARRYHPPLHIQRHAQHEGYRQKKRRPGLGALQFGLLIPPCNIYSHNILHRSGMPFPVHVVGCFPENVQEDLGRKSAKDDLS